MHRPACYLLLVAIMSELTRAEIQALLKKSADLIREIQAVQAQLQRALNSARPIRQTERRNAPRKSPK